MSCLFCLLLRKYLNIKIYSLLSLRPWPKLFTSLTRLQNKTTLITSEIKAPVTAAASRVYVLSWYHFTATCKYSQPSFPCWNPDLNIQEAIKHQVCNMSHTCNRDQRFLLFTWLLDWIREASLGSVLTSTSCLLMHTRVQSAVIHSWKQTFTNVKLYSSEQDVQN